jgi:hypothetical protein
VRRIAAALLTLTVAVAIPATAAAAAADAATQPATVASPGVHLDMRLGGLRAVVHADRCGVYERVTGRLLGIKQSFSISC